MLRDHVHLFCVLPAGVPEWVHLLPAGTFTGTDGRGPFVLEDAQAVIAASMAAGKLALDENHSIDLAAPKGEPAPARGWIVAMEARADGIWGRVEWTAAGRALVSDHAYRGISPVVVTGRSDGRVIRLLRASLVNDPNLPLAMLHNRSRDQKDPPMDFLAQVRAALGLPADATEAAVLGALGAHAAAVKAIATAAGVADGTAPAEVATTVARHLRCTRSEEAKLRETVTTLQSSLDRLEADRRRSAAETFVDGAIKAGKPVRALRDHYVTRHMRDAAAVETEIGALVSIHSGGATPPRTDAGGRAGLTPDQQHACTLMGLDPKAYAETLTEMTREAI